MILLEWIKAHKRTVSLLISTLFFLVTLLLFFYSRPNSVVSVSTTSSTAPTAYVSTPVVENSVPKPDLSLITSKLRSEKSDGTILFYMLLLFAVGFMLYSIFNKDKKR